LQRYKEIYICGNYSGILSKLDRRFKALEIRRAFTVFQLMTVLEEAGHSIILVGHDPIVQDLKKYTVSYPFFPSISLK
jgi:hypothetical protein